MIGRWAPLLSTLSALGLASCADHARKEPATAPVVTRTAPVVTQKAEVSPASAAEVPAKTGRVTRIPLGNFFQHQQAGDALIIDVRPGFYYGLGHVPGALNWPRAAFDSGLPIFEPKIKTARAAGKPIFLYCTDLACPDALNVANRLAARGHSVAVLEGGWEAWKTGELPIE